MCADVLGANREYRSTVIQLLFAALSFLLMVSCALSQTDNIPSQKQAAIREIVSESMVANKTPGVSVAIVVDGELSTLR